MNWLAIKMLLGDRTKFLGLVFGVTFATLLMTQQVSIFIGIVGRAGSQIRDIRDVDVWVMDERTRQIDEARPLPDADLQRVRGVAGVDWAVKMYKGQVAARLENGEYRNVVLEGLDDESLVGAPPEMIAGSIADLRQPNAVIVDKAGYTYMWPNEPIKVGRELEMNERRAVLVGVCKASPPFVTLPVMFTRFREAAQFAPGQRNFMNYVLVKATPGAAAEQVAQQIHQATGLLALTNGQFFWHTIKYFLGSTGIPVNFGITIGLGFIVGVAIAGQTFYLFVVENLKQFGSLKAMGVNNRRIVLMILLQAVLVGLLGYSFGVGGTALFFESTAHIPHLSGLGMSWEVMAGVGAAVAVIVVLSIFLSVRRVLVLEPAVVFRG